MTLGNWNGPCALSLTIAASLWQVKSRNCLSPSCCLSRRFAMRSNEYVTSSAICRSIKAPSIIEMRMLRVFGSINWWPEPWFRIRPGQHVRGGWVRWAGYKDIASTPNPPLPGHLRTTPASFHRILVFHSSPQSTQHLPSLRLTTF